MNETSAPYQIGKTSTVISGPQKAIAELSAYYAQIPEDLLSAGKPSAVVVYGILDRIAHNGDGWASIEAIAERSNLSIRTVQTARAWLIANGWVLVLHQGRSGKATDYELPWRSSRQHAMAPIPQDAQIAPSECNNDILQPAKVAHHSLKPSPEPKTEPLFKEAAQAEKNGQDAKEVWPDWYGTLWMIPGFKVPLAHAQGWLDEKNIGAAHAETTAYALKSRWPGPVKNPYRDPWATFQNWVKRPPLPGPPSQRYGRPEIPGTKDDYDGPMDGMIQLRVVARDGSVREFANKWEKQIAWQRHEI